MSALLLALLGGNIQRILKGLGYVELLTSLLILALGLLTVAYFLTALFRRIS